jgi:hypothetical protein
MPSFTLEEKKLARERERTHKIRLQKRLAKARKQLGIADQQQECPGQPTQPLRQARDKDSGKRWKKPDPAKEAKELGRNCQFEREQRQFEQDLERKRRQRQLQECKHRRAQEKKVMYKRNATGQLLLSHQVSHLLTKIQQQ